MLIIMMKYGHEARIMKANKNIWKMKALR